MSGCIHRDDFTDCPICDGRPTAEMIRHAAWVIGKRERLSPTGERALDTARAALLAALAHPGVDTEGRVDKISRTGECVPGVDLPAGPSCLPEGRLDWGGAEQVLPETSGKIATSDCPGVDTEA